MCANLIVHRSNTRLADDLATLLRHAPQIVITSVGSPAPVLQTAARRRRARAGRCREHPPRRARRRSRRRRTGAAHGRRGRPDRLAQSVRVRSRRAAVLSRADRARRRNQRRPRAARGRGARLRPCLYGHQVHRHAREHGRSPLQGHAGRKHRRRRAADARLHRLADQHAAPSIVAAGLDPDDLPERGAIDIARDIDVGARDARPKRWRDIWSAGHSTSGVRDVLSVAELVEQTIAEYRSA